MAIPIYQARFYGYQWSMDQETLAPPVSYLQDGRQPPRDCVGREVAQWCGSYGYVEMAIALAVTNERATGRIYHVADSEVLSEAERLSRVGQVAGWAKSLLSPVSTRRMELAIQHRQHWFVDTTCIRQN